jgi:hypothetical protein
MATREKHISQWKHNREFLCTISPNYPDWIVTACFYTAVHAIDTLLAHDKFFPTSHDSRNEVLVKTNRYAAIYKSYGPLYTLSRTVRYFANPTVWIKIEDIQPKVIEKYLYPIEKSVQKLTGVDLSLPKIIIRSETLDDSAIRTPQAESAEKLREIRAATPPSPDQPLK